MRKLMNNGQLQGNISQSTHSNAHLKSGVGALPTSVVQRAVKIEAASIVAGHELNQVPYPGVACTRKTRKSHQGAGSVRQKHPLFAPGV